MKKTPDQIISEWVERDLSAEAEKGTLPCAFAVDHICERIGDILSSARHPVLTGESGIGKTAAVYELIRKACEDGAPEILKGRRILQISFRRRASSLKKPIEQMRPEMQKLVDALFYKKGSIALFIRDLHLAYQYDLEPQIQLLAHRGSCPMIAEGDWAGLCELFECTPELEQDFITLPFEEPSLDVSSEILTAWSASQQDRRHRFTENAIEEALFLTHRFLARDRLPRKAIDLLKQTGSMNPEGQAVEADLVLERFCSQHRIPRFLVDPAIPLDLAQVEEAFQHRVLGQDQGVQAVVKMVGLIKAGLSDMRRPFGAFLFVGPTGVGKTHLAQFLAEYLFGSHQRMVRLNMSDYPNENDARLLFGDPDSDNLRTRRGLFTQRITGHPFAVMLLDELEKAHPKVHDRLLQLIDEGAFYNGAGENVSCRSMIIIATSNAGAEIYRGQGIGFTRFVDYQSMDRDVDQRLEKIFRFEFLNRFDQVVHFHPLAREHIRVIAQRELERLETRPGLKQRGLKLDVDESVLDWLAVNGYDADFGARFLRRMIERHVATALAQAIVRSGSPGDTVLSLRVKRNRIHASLPSEKKPSKARRTVVLPFGAEEKERSLNFSELISEAETLLKTAEKRLAALDEKKREAGGLLERMNTPDFWKDGERKQKVIEKYRALDVSIRMESRLAESVLHMGELMKAPNRRKMDIRSLSEAIAAAAKDLREWDERLAEDGIGSVWMVIVNADPIHPAGEFIEMLTSMELAWCRKLSLSASVAAYGLNDGEPSRTVLDIEGPGASMYLSMEQGYHRLRTGKTFDIKAKIDVIPKSGRTPSKTSSKTPDIPSVRRRHGLFGLNICCRGAVKVPDRGISLEYFGTDAEDLSALISDLERGWTGFSADEAETARIYGEGGVARDPRTLAVMPRLKDVWKGRLDIFLEGWRQERGFMP